jgi:acyl-CoA thioesterase-2
MSPTLYEVDRIRDGKSFSTRRVVAIQHGRPIYNLQASFHVDEESIEHQIDMPEVPAPETIMRTLDRIKLEGGDDDGWLSRAHPIDHRYVGNLPWDPKRSREPRRQVWMRADGQLPDDPLLHACVVAYASDMTLFDTILAPHDIRWDDGTFMGASLDHCMWFHRDVRADDWFLYDQDSPVAFGGRGLARGFLFSQDGVLRVSMVQEGLTRLLNPDHRAQ